MSAAPKRQADPPLTTAEFARLAGVSRETLGRLQIHAALLSRWQRAINLIGPATIPDLWRRHFLDSAQLFPLVPAGTRVLTDLGSGAGFPGLVLAAMGVSGVHLVECDGRKCAFLREVARAAGLSVTVREGRAEDLPPWASDVVTARALAPLTKLLPLVWRFLGEGGVAILAKGRAAKDELTAAAAGWKMRAERFPSLTDPEATILRLSALRPADASRSR